MQPKNKIQKLKPSARDKRRYLVIDEPSNQKIEKAILEYIGILGYAKAAYMPVKENGFKNKTISSCLAKELNNVKAALALAKIKVENVSGTIKGLSR